MGDRIAGSVPLSGAENPGAHPLVRQALADGWAACAAEGAPPERPFAQGTSAILYAVPAVRGQALPGVLKIPVYHRRPPDWYPGLERDVLREARLLREYACGSLPRLFAVDAGGRYLCREYVAGPALSALPVWRDAATLAVVLRALLTTARELFARFHDAPRGCMVIRDLKPENFVAAEDLRVVRLIDVAAARRKGEAHSARHQAGVLGTGRRPYRPPEELMGRRERFDRRLDYFAFGATAFFVLTGRPPYDNREPDPDRVMAVYGAQYVQALPELRAAAQRAGLPGATAEFLAACLHPQAAQRPRDFPGEDGR